MQLWLLFTDKRPNFFDYFRKLGVVFRIKLLGLFTKESSVDSEDLSEECVKNYRWMYDLFDFGRNSWDYRGHKLSPINQGKALLFH